MNGFQDLNDTSEFRVTFFPQHFMQSDSVQPCAMCDLFNAVRARDIRNCKQESAKFRLRVLQYSIQVICRIAWVLEPFI